MIFHPARADLSTAEGNTLVGHGTPTVFVDGRLDVLTAEVFFNPRIVLCKIFLSLKELAVCREELMMGEEIALFHLTEDHTRHKGGIGRYLMILAYQHKILSDGGNFALGPLHKIIRNKFVKHRNIGLACGF